MHGIVTAVTMVDEERTQRSTSANLGMGIMRNIQIIDGALNCEYAIYAATDEEFKLIFPKIGQNIEFIEDLTKRMGDKCLGIFMQKIWERRIYKPDAQGIHGTLFYQLNWKKKYYPTKREEEMIVPLANEAITPNDPRPL